MRPSQRVDATGHPGQSSLDIHVQLSQSLERELEATSAASALRPQHGLEGLVGRVHAEAQDV